MRSCVLLLPLDIDECLVNNPCQSSATCENNYGSYTCICNSGYEAHPTIDNLCVGKTYCCLFMVIVMARS